MKYFDREMNKKKIYIYMIFTILSTHDTTMVKSFLEVVFNA